MESGRPASRESAMTPRLMRATMPTFASILPDYSNSEQDYIRMAFNAGNWAGLGRVPHAIKPSVVTKARQEAIDTNVRAVREPRVARKPGLFNEFQYMPSRYSLADELRKQARLEDVARRMEVGGKDFIPGGRTKKLKHEDAFEDKEARYPYMSNPFDAAQVAANREKWLQESKVLGTAWRPSGSDRPISHPSRSTLPDCLTALHKSLESDWEIGFSVVATEDDIVVIRFVLAEVDSEKGLKAYMNIMARSSEIVGRYKLSRMVEDWGTRPGDGYMYFMFRPPWVKARPTDAYVALYGEASSPASTRSTVKYSKQGLKK